jgi:adenosylhomocysteine nucleosidase
VTIIVLAAERFEIEGFAATLSGRQRKQFPFGRADVGKWGDHDVVCAVSGMGYRAAYAAATALISFYRPAWLISAGLCGALDENLRLAQVVTGREVIQVETGERFAAQAWAEDAVRVVSQDRIASTASEKQQLSKHGEIVEMEAAAAAKAAARGEVSFACVKSVSDLASEGFTIDINRFRREDGTLKASAATWSAIRSPFSGVPELISLYRRSRMAARRLSDYLEGELLGLCRV